MKIRNLLKMAGILLIFSGIISCKRIEKDVITWIVPDVINATEIRRNIELVNRELEEDGYTFSLEVKILSRNSYREDIIPYLTEGKADIVSLGMDYVDGSAGYAEDLIREGYFEELSAYLFSNEGEKLKKEYCDVEWKIVETDGGIYSVPNQTGMKRGSSVVFNKKYVPENILEGYTGTVEELESVLDSLELPQDIYPIVGQFTISDLAAMCGTYVDFGVLVDLNTGEVENPFQNDKFCQCLKTLHDFYEKGYMGMPLDYAMENEVLKKGNYAIWICNGYEEFTDEIKNKVYIEPLNFAIQSSLSLSTGISKNSENRDKALQTLTLIYTEEKYTNLLLYGEEGIDYQMLDGYVYDMRQQEMDAFRRSLMFGVYDHAYPCRADDLTTNRNEKKQEMYTSEYLLDSKVLGFQVDPTDFDESMLNIDKITTAYSKIWQEKDFDAALQEAILVFENAGGNKVTEELNRQIADWMQKTKR